MNPPSETLFTAWRDLFFENIDPLFLSDEIVDYCDDRFNEWIGDYLDGDERPSGSAIVQFAWKINAELAGMEISSLSMSKGD